MNQEFILRWPDVKKRVGLGRTHVYQLIVASKFPKQIKLSECASGWVDSEIDQWIEDRIQARGER